MDSHCTISSSTFADTYRDVIRVGLNWDRFFREDWAVELVTLESREDLARCFMPWYIGTTVEEVAYDFPGACPMSMSDLPATIKILNDERQADIQKYVAQFRSQKELIEFSAPTYALPDDRFFVLDRNHRLSALALTKVPFKVTLWNIRGPLDPDGLLDLIHWLPIHRA